MIAPGPGVCPTCRRAPGDDTPVCCTTCAMRAEELEPVERYTIRAADGSPLAETFDHDVAHEHLRQRQERGERVYLEQAPSYRRWRR